ncbi:MAG: tetratricopeptide repeat protein [Candidatus Omnitrophota bacterium]|nr:tetratricopeptide repeat protein [Candidatus Omnitrophota bacterium]
MNKSKLILFIGILFILALSCAAAYSNSVHNPFIWDDDALVVKNPLLSNWSNLPKVFTSDLYPGVTAGSNFYRPLQTISYIWDYHFWQLDPFGYHLSNIILQILVSLLVFLLTRIMLKDTKIALAAALLFALNPLHTEAVTYISGRAEMLMGLFLLASLILFIKGHRVFSLLSFICGLLSKELSVVFPLVILAYLFYYKREKLKKARYLLKSVLPFLIIDLIYLILRSGLLHFATIRPPALTKYPFILRVIVFPKVMLTYLKLFILPVDLHMSRTLARPVNFLSLFWSCFFLGMIFVFCAYILKNYKQRKTAAFMLCWFLIFLLPQSGILPINAFIAEHFIYLSSISVFILLAYLLRKYLRRGLFIFSVIGLALFYAMLTYTRNFDWSDPLVFYSKIIKYSPDSFQAHNNLGLQYEYRHDLRKAILEYKRALEIEPKLIEARSNLANAYFKLGKFKDALSEYAQVEKSALREKAGELQNNIGCIYEVEGLLDEALDRYRLALRLDPALNFTHFNIARIYAAKAKFDLAAQEVIKSLPELSLTDFYSSRSGHLSVRYGDKDRYAQVISAYVKSSKAFQSGVIFYNDLGVKFASENLLEGAIAAFKRVIELDPLYADAHFNLGLAFWKKGLKKEAIFEFKRALKINPNHLNAKGFLR